MSSKKRYKPGENPCVQANIKSLAPAVVAPASSVPSPEANRCLLTLKSSQKYVLVDPTKHGGRRGK